MESLEDKENLKQITNYESKNKLAFVFLFLGLIVADQVSKRSGINIFKNFVFAFSLPLPVWLIYLIYGIVMAAMVIFFMKNYRKFSSWQTIAWVLIFAGALSNIVERMVLGYVRDWIYLFTGIFNLADFYIILGIVLLLFINPDSKTRGI